MKKDRNIVWNVQEEANATRVLLLRKTRNTVAQKARASKKKQKTTDRFVQYVCSYRIILSS